MPLELKQIFSNSIHLFVCATTIELLNKSARTSGRRVEHDPAQGNSNSKIPRSLSFFLLSFRLLKQSSVFFYYLKAKKTCLR